MTTADTDDGNVIDTAGLPRWAKRLLDDLDGRFGVGADTLTHPNFPNGTAPRWLEGDTYNTTQTAPEWIESFFLDASYDLQSLWLDQGFLADDPRWLTELLRRERADVARVFLLTGNIHDYAFSPDQGYMPVLDRLEESAARRKGWVIRYSLSNGFSVPRRGARTADGEATPFEDLDIEDASAARRRDGSRHPRDALQEDFRIIEELLRQQYDNGLCLVVENLHKLLPPNNSDVEQNVLSDAIQRWAQAPWMFQSQNLVVLTADSPESLDSEFRSNTNYIESIDVPRPEDRADRLKFLISLFATGADAMRNVRLVGGPPRLTEAFGDDITTKLLRLADRTSGLNLVGLENLVLQANVDGDGQLTSEFIKETKREILSKESGGLLEVSEPANVDRTEAFDHIGGLGRIQERLLQISEMMDEGSEFDIVRRSLPKGLLFLGPPGTGKTLVARAFANACGVNFAEFGDIRSMWVGESERNLSRALGLIRSLKPVVVFVDEIDQNIGQRGGATDSGVDQRIFARILQFMSDPDLEGEVVWIAASNEPAQIDAALKRAGRFDLTIPFLRPPSEARRQIFEIQFENRGVTTEFTDEQWDAIVDSSEGYTGAEIEGVIKEAVWHRLVTDSARDSVTVPFESVRQAFESYQPPVDRTEYRRMENAALVEVTAVDMLTPEYQERRDDYLKQLAADVEEQP